MKARESLIGVVIGLTALLFAAPGLWGTEAPTGLTPEQIVRKTVDNEVKASQSGGVNHMIWTARSNRSPVVKVIGTNLNEACYGKQRHRPEAAGLMNSLGDRRLLSTDSRTRMERAG